MARFSGGDRTGAGSTTQPILSLYSIAALRPVVREIGVFNTTATAVELQVIRLTATTNRGAALTDEASYMDEVSPQASLYASHTGAATTGDLVKTGVLGAAVGSGIIWTFGAEGLIIPDGTANGVGIIVANGTGQVCQAYITWDE